MANLFLLYATIFFVAIVAVATVVSVIQGSRKGRVSAWVNRILYLAGMAAALMNFIRMLLVYETYKGTMAFASVIVMVSLAIGLVRSEQKTDGTDSEKEEG
ncbi:MAG: hypothetical protein LUE86_13300 [Clostridiales bacterium]|nr:hypothetical protein [Clostridiales bacterium]